MSDGRSINRATVDLNNFLAHQIGHCLGPFHPLTPLLTGRQELVQVQESVKNALTQAEKQ